eukprot:5289858-Amphidinium_carterae.1
MRLMLRLQHKDLQLSDYFLIEYMTEVSGVTMARTSEFCKLSNCGGAHEVTVSFCSKRSTCCPFH